MRRTFPRRGVAIAALALFAPLALLGAGDSKKKKPPEPSAPKVDETIGSLANVPISAMKVEGVGLVVGLDNTGSDPPPSAQRAQLINDMRKANVEHPDKWLARPSCSMVIVRAFITNGVAPEDPIDVEIEIPAASGTTSLAGGRLLTTELTPVMNTSAGVKNGKMIAHAGGPVLTGKTGDPTNLKVGRVLGGARVKAEIPYNLIIKDERRSARTSKLVEDVIKLRFHQSDGLDQKSMATAKDDRLLILKVPKVYHRNQGRYFQVIQNLCLVDNPGLRAQRMEAWGKALLDPKTSGQAALRLEGLGSNAVPTLKAGLVSTDPQVKFFAAESLAYLSHIEGADVLAETATKRPEFRSYALKALAAMDQTAGLMRLRTLMSQPDFELRYGAFDALRSFDPSDPFLGQVSILQVDEPKEEELNDAMAIQINFDPRRRRRPSREEPFKLYVVDCEGPPLVHVSRNLRCEVVIFGKGQKMLPPVVLGAGGAVLLNAAEGDERVQVSRIAQDTLDQADSRITCSLEIAEIVRGAARLGATYPELVGILANAFNQKNLPGPLVVDAVPLPTKVYTEVQLTGSPAKKDDAIKKTKAEEPKKPSVIGRLRDRMKR